MYSPIKKKKITKMDRQQKVCTIQRKGKQTNKQKKKLLPPIYLMLKSPSSKVKQIK